jgi:hypothetical protein
MWSQPVLTRFQIGQKFRCNNTASPPTPNDLPPGMVAIVITIRDDGHEGEIQLLDAEGKPFGAANWFNIGQFQIQSGWTLSV